MKKEKMFCFLLVAFAVMAVFASACVAEEATSLANSCVPCEQKALELYLRSLSVRSLAGAIGYGFCYMEWIMDGCGPEFYPDIPDPRQMIKRFFLPKKEEDMGGQKGAESFRGFSAPVSFFLKKYLLS